MTAVISRLSTPLDGFIAGVEDSPTQPLGLGGEQLFRWFEDGDMRSRFYPERSMTVTTSDRHDVSIFEAAGGQAAFVRLAAAHHQRCLADPVLHHPFSHSGHPQHVERLAAYWAEVFGGPPSYTREAGDHSFMLDLHARTQADADLGTRFVRCFVAALDDAGLPPDKELRAALRAYMEWAVRDVLSYAPADAVVPAGRPIPRWSWGGLQADPDR